MDHLNNQWAYITGLFTQTEFHYIQVVLQRALCTDELTLGVQVGQVKILVLFPKSEKATSAPAA